MRKYPILMIAWAMWPSVANADLRTTLTSALQGYCIPKEGGCGTYQARYQNGSCYCGAYTGTYMYYDEGARTCRPKCPAGQVPELTSGCQGGYEVLLIKDF
jgi:hypothetical protein